MDKASKTVTKKQKQDPQKQFIAAECTERQMRYFIMYLRAHLTKGPLLSDPTHE